MSTARLEKWACPWREGFKRDMSPEGGLQKWACPVDRATAAHVRRPAHDAGARRWTCPASTARTGHNPHMSTARLEKWACPRRGRLQKWACPPGAQRKVAAPEGTATFKLQTAWPQGADSLRNTGN